MNHIKGLLETDWYHTKVVNVETEDDVITLYWKVDVGPHAYRTLIDKFNETEYGFASLERMCDKVNFTMFAPDHPEFYEQFLGLRAKLYVSVTLDRDVKKNVILDYTLPDVPEQYNVLAEKKDDHFFERKHKPKLPI